jgi:integrase
MQFPWPMGVCSMASIRRLESKGTLFMDFRYGGKRLREYTELPDTAMNRKRLQKALDKIETDIALGTFDYEKTFGKPLLQRDTDVAQANVTMNPVGMATHAVVAQTPNFREFANQWYGETEITWRRSYKITQRGALDKYILPTFGDKLIGMVTKADVLAFRADLSKLKGRGKNASMTARRINAIMKPLRQILNEAADRYNFNSPFRNIKPLRMKRSEVMPFTMAEVQLLITSVRPDFQSYFKTRIFTGMRTGEVNGLKWKYVDFERRLIYVRESIVLGEEDELKTDGSMRDIQMSQIVFDALTAQFEVTGKLSDYVFCNRAGNPIDNKNFINRVWSPLLRHLGLEHRKAYQMRHTAATLWLASGEAPEWIARQLGHTTTEMLFRVYSRYVPNLTRNDGSAIDRLLTSTFIATPVSPAQPALQDIPAPAVVLPNDVPTAVVSNAREIRAAPISTSGNGANRDAQAPPIRWADMAKSWMSNDSSYESAA